MISSYVAIGDSFTEGLGDEWPDGTPRGWADRLAEALAAQSSPGVFRYANLAIRGRKLEPILEEQLDAAIAMSPDLISLNGGGNDMLRPGFKLDHADAMLRQAVDKIRAANIRVLLLSGPNPAGHLPMGWIFDRRGSAFVDVSSAWATAMGGVFYCDNFHHEDIMAPHFWSEDGLHLSSAGHLQVAINCLAAMDAPTPKGWDVQGLLDSTRVCDFRSVEYYKTYVGPWINRRLTGKSSGDGRQSKRPALAPLDS